MKINIVLCEPEIPNNTGNIGRLSLATKSRLHLIKPYGFEINDKRVRRAGLDYWKHVNLIEHDSFEDFLRNENPDVMAFLSSHGKTSYLNIPFKENIYVVFGKESVGLSATLKTDYSDHLYKIPLNSSHIRSLNLANAVAVVVYEGLRQMRRI